MLSSKFIPHIYPLARSLSNASFASWSWARVLLSEIFVCRNSSIISGTLLAVDWTAFVQGAQPRLRYLIPFFEKIKGHDRYGFPVDVLPDIQFSPMKGRMNANVRPMRHLPHQRRQRAQDASRCGDWATEANLKPAAAGRSLR